MFPIIDFLLEEKLSGSQFVNPRSISPENYGRLKDIIFTHYLHQRPLPENLEFQQALIERGAVSAPFVLVFLVDISLENGGHDPTARFDVTLEKVVSIALTIPVMPNINFYGAILWLVTRENDNHKIHPHRHPLSNAPSS
ncbi:hypothetical protein K435DRAFT_798313 [Dendrothele bispora CBS 962.96]|uniref:Uncharacterized protein n=1 Tax=Dendrothele bispora (strain CBS 962.96) TaxID=1314807 RepID=A0A4S8M0Y3_DENBC|nr:hypothetical protein K435DRAFT_798313 [Dendrothele bispora CBS 962.96]